MFNLFPYPKGKKKRTHRRIKPGQLIEWKKQKLNYSDNEPVKVPVTPEDDE